MKNSIRYLRKPLGRLAARTACRWCDSSRADPAGPLPLLPRLQAHDLWALELPEGQSVLSKPYGMFAIAGSVSLLLIYIKWLAEVRGVFHTRGAQPGARPVVCAV